MKMDLNQISDALLPALISDRAALKNDLDSFINSNNKYGNFFLRQKNDYFMQGDLLLKGFSLYNFDTKSEVVVSGIILSNTCDISSENERKVAPRVVFCPLMPMSAFRARLVERNLQPKDIDYQLEQIRNQEATGIFYIPHSGEIGDEILVRLDDVHSMPMSELEPSIGNRVLSLSQFGYYLLLFKLSIHFCRFHEGPIRSN